MYLCYMKLVRFYLIYTLQIVRSLSIQRLWNICKLTITYFLSYICKLHIFNSLPATISIEPTNICNLQCPECPTGNKSSKVAKGKMELYLCQKLIPQIKDTVFFANIYFQGEPFINEQTIPIVELANKANIITSISTNAHFITDENSEAIVKSGLTKLIISLDGYNQGTYEKYRRNGSFDKVLRGMKAIKEAKERNHSKLPLVELQCLLFKHTENHKKEIQDIGIQYGADIVLFKTAQFYDEQNIEMLPSTKNSRYNLTNGKLEIKNKQKNKCWKMWCSCIVAWNGNVLPCCFDKNHTFTFGNCLNTDIKTIWFSEKYKHFRTLIHTNRKSIEMCQNCTS